MLELQKFVLNNADWREKLAEAPYFITIKEDNDLIMFSYNLIKGSDFSLPIVRECRGIILEKGTWNVVCRAFDKFGNYGENYVPEIDWESAIVTEKIDGSLIKVFNYKNKWRIATNNSINAFDCKIEEARYSGSFGELFIKTFEKHYDSFDKWTSNIPYYTYMFELVSPYTQVVVPYAEPDIFYLGCRSNNTGIEHSFFEKNMGFKTPEIYPLTSLEAVQKAAAALPLTEEGYVVVDKFYNRCKIKSPEYVKAHYFRNNNQISKSRLIDVIKSGEEAEFLIYCPEYKEIIEKMKAVRRDYKNYLENIIFAIKSFGYTKNKTKKEFVMWLKNRNYDDFTYQFFLYWFDNQDFTFEDWTKSWTTSRWLRFYKEMEDKK